MANVPFREFIVRPTRGSNCFEVRVLGCINLAGQLGAQQNQNPALQGYLQGLQNQDQEVAQFIHAAISEKIARESP